MLSLTLKEVLTNLREGKISAKELCERCFERWEKTKALNAVITPIHSFARSQAERSSQNLLKSAKQPVRELEGVPFIIKDNFCLDGVRTTCASRMLKDYVPPYTATVVQKLIDNGAVLLGKANMDEFAMGSGTVDSIFGPARNPWLYDFSGNATNENWCVSGGSSGGSAVAVATGMCFGAFGSDTGGSVRNPASYCGVVGLKPSYGLLSRHGLIPLVNSLDVPGIFAKCVDDAAYIESLVAGLDVKDSTTIDSKMEKGFLPEDISVKGLHIGIPKEFHSPGLSPEILEAWRHAADMFENAGAKVSQVSLPHSQFSIICYTVLCCCEVASNFARYDGIEFGLRSKENASTEEMFAASRHEGFNDVVRGRIFAGNFMLLRRNYERYFLHAQKIRRLIHNDFTKVYADGVDVLLTPTTLSPAITFEEFSKKDNRANTEEQDLYTEPANMAGVPAVSIPVKMSSGGLPISLQLIGQIYKDREMLMAAKWLEQICAFKPLDLSYL